MSTSVITPVMKVLLVEDNVTDAMLARDELTHTPSVECKVHHVVRLQEALACITSQTFDIILLDLNLPDSEGLPTLLRLNSVAPTLPVVVLSHRADEQLSLSAVQAGAQDYLVKGRGDGRLVQAMRYAIERKRTELRLQYQNQALVMLASNAPLTDILSDIVRSVERLNPGVLASILLLDEQGTHLRLGAAPNLPDFYNHAIDGLAIGSSVSSCGAAAFSGKRVIVDDIASHPNWLPFRELAHRAGLGSGWSRPIFSSQQKVIGSFALYHSEARTLEPVELQLIDDEARLAGIAIEKAEVQTRLQLTASVFTHAHEGILITDIYGTIVEVNDTFTQITGYTREEALGNNPRMYKSDRHDPAFYEAMWADIKNHGHWHGELWNQRKNGDIYAEMITISAVHDAEGKVQHYIGLFTDITATKVHQLQLEHLAHFDALTGLPNRVLLADRLQQAMLHSHRRNQAVAVAYLDLDGFKEINDCHGHAVGDEMLFVIGSRLKAALRDGDTLARIGGDEFIAVMVDLEHPQDCDPLLARLLQAAADPVLLGDKTLQVSASIGVTFYPQDNVSPDQLIRHADQAMYLAKQSGKNCCLRFDVERDTAVKSKHQQLYDVSHAFYRNEFVLYYQPKVNLRTGIMTGVEALIRWQHPQRGLLLPSSFLPGIMDHPFSVTLGEWVIDTVLCQMDEWKVAGFLIPVSVNIDAHQLQQDGFVSRLSQQLAAHPTLVPLSLELEILETSALHDIALVSNIIHDCQLIGVSFAIDDFGTGYSSLTYLKRLQAEMIKIDQSFIHDMLEDADDLAIVKGIIGLAKAFHRQVIAEGVETAAHSKMLLPLGCELAQGFGIAHPMPAADLPEWMTNWELSASVTSHVNLH